MKISKQLKDQLLVEMRFAAKKMKEEQDPRRKLYFFSGVYGASNRILNIEFDADLLFLSVHAQNCYNMISPRVDQIYIGRDNLIPLPKRFFESLGYVVERLADAVERDKGLDSALRDLAILAYSTTGNGAYLVERGKMELPAQ